MAVAVATTPELRAGMPETLFEIPTAFQSDTVGRNYDVTADGQRFLTVLGADSAGPPQLVVVPDFRDELRARLAVATR